MHSLCFDFHPVIDVSGQGEECTITPLNPSTLTTDGGVLPIGTENVMIRCTCTDTDGIPVTTIRWYDPDRALVPRVGSGEPIDLTAPHITRPDGHNNNRNITLVIPTFNDFYYGTYTCGRRNNYRPPLPPTATINLSIGK